MEKQRERHNAGTDSDVQKNYQASRTEEDVEELCLAGEETKSLEGLPSPMKNREKLLELISQTKMESRERRNKNRQDVAVEMEDDQEVKKGWS
ncbi:hypothetical protein RUM44_004874 [Polyplax serrata]|uniref:Uncharacterized protein n=1 Tax=Polyplax serrata TaxID=468196 RepID=A0ABR1B5T8_POLSC